MKEKTPKLTHAQKAIILGDNPPNKPLRTQICKLLLECELLYDEYVTKMRLQGRAPAVSGREWRARLFQMRQALASEPHSIGSDLRRQQSESKRAIRHPRFGKC